MDCETAIAHGGLKAIEKAVEFQADVILLDVSILRLNGYDVARRIGAMPPTNQLKLIAFTGLGKAEDSCRAHEAGFHAHLTKLINLEALIKVLDEI